MKLNYSELSRVMSHALRHKPERYHLKLDSEGWVSIESLLTALRPLKKHWQKLSIQDLENTIANSDKKRHEIVDGKIRALYGHSIIGKIHKQSISPPDILYHGTAPEIAEIILVEGLKPMNRQYVHLALEIKEAVKVGKRKSHNPVILKVYALKAFKDGINFYKGNKNIWLSEPILPQYIEKN